jgi:restriction system protein
MATKAAPSGPRFVQYFGPIVVALHQLGGSARPAEATDEVARHLKVTDAERAEPNQNGQSRFDNAVAWARFYLAKAGYIDASKRGVWRLTDKGREKKTLTHAEALAIFKSVQTDIARTRGALAEPPPGAQPPTEESTAGAFPGTHREEILSILQSLPPEGFERFCQELLRESDFQEVTVTGRSGDGGIDGLGVLQVNRLVSFKVVFQCKRYKGTVSPSQVRDFRGAMMGRADKGIILTTGTFSADAKKEALRDGAPPVELVDGEKLVRMMEELELGLKPVQSFSVDRSFFDDFGLNAKSA